MQGTRDGTLTEHPMVDTAAHTGSCSFCRARGCLSAWAMARRGGAAPLGGPTVSFDWARCGLWGSSIAVPPRACSHHQAVPSMVEWQQENIFLPFLPALKQPQTRLKSAKTCRTMQRKSGSLFPIGNLPRSHLESICPHPYITPLQKRSENIEKIKYLLQRIGTRD